MYKDLNSRIAKKLNTKEPVLQNPNIILNMPNHFFNNSKNPDVIGNEKKENRNINICGS